MSHTTTLDRSWQSYRAEYASLTQYRNPDDPELLDARRNLRAAKLAEHIARVVAEAPPLTPEQRDRLAILLRGGASDGAAA